MAVDKSDGEALRQMGDSNSEEGEKKNSGF